MEEMIAYCGLACQECGAFLATRENDDQKREQVARQWSRMFKAEINPGDINCKGCLSREEPLFSHCKICEIRSCGLGRGVVHCGVCADYPCTKLDVIFKGVPAAKERLDEIHRSR
jgi:Protein of unknown function (DUF3795)